MNDKTRVEQLFLREVQISDTVALMSLMAQLGYAIDEKTLSENIQQYRQQAKQKSWVAEIAGQVIGCIAVAITDYLHRRGSFLRVMTLVVAQEHRRSGVGKSLISFAEQFSIEQGCVKIELTTAMHREKLGSHQFYQSLGYIVFNDVKKYFVKELP